MKILFITNNFHPLVCGVGDYVYNLCREFHLNGHQVIVVCHKDERIKDDCDYCKVYPVVDYWNKEGLKEVIDIIKKEYPNVISLQYVPHAFEPHGLPFHLISFTEKLKELNIPLFTFCHEVCISCKSWNPKTIAMTLLMQCITSRILQHSTTIATSIEHYKRKIHQLCPSYHRELKVIPIASNIPEIKIDDSQVNLLKKRIAPNDELIISLFGQRTITSTIKAIRQLNKEGKKLKMLLIGKTFSKITGELPDFIYATGVLDMKDLNQYFQISDIFVLPETKNGCSFKSGSLIAALNNRLPVITSKGNMTDSQLINEENILFADFSDSSKLKKSIEYLVNDSMKRKKIGKNGSIIAQTINWKRTYAAYMELLR